MIQACALGKIKTAIQVGAIVALIATDPAPLGVDILVYVALLVTVASGVDYFFGFRRMMAEAQADAKAPRAADQLPPGPRATRASWCDAGSARRSRSRR